MAPGAEGPLPPRPSPEPPALLPAAGGQRSTKGFNQRADGCGAGTAARGAERPLLLWVLSAVVFSILNTQGMARQCDGEHPTELIPTPPPGDGVLLIPLPTSVVLCGSK